MLGTQLRSHYQFRVFISYSHADQALVDKLVPILEQVGLYLLWDKKINPGNRFADEIKQLISRSHVFIPLITPNSTKSSWVHQEIGFAIALNIPILPICIDTIPDGMLAEVQAITTQNDLSDLSGQLEQIDLEQFILPKPSVPLGTILIAESFGNRLEYMLNYANAVLDGGDYGLIRVQARFSGFAIPNVAINDPVWDQREGEAKREPEIRELQLKERRILERHARIAGCRMIIDPRAATAKKQGDYAHQARVLTLLDFLKSMPLEKTEVVISPQAQSGSLTIVGDHFLAESKAFQVGGYIHTAFNSHPPSVLQRVRRFDQLFYEIQAQNGTTTGDVIKFIESLCQDFNAIDQKNE